MRKTYNVIVLSLVVILLLSMPAFAAEDETDWENFDWTQYRWSNLDDDNVCESLSNWLETKADLKELFTVDANCAHAAFGETITTIVYERFCSDPVTMIRALAREDTTTQDRVTWSIVSGGYQLEQFIPVLESIKLSASDYAKASGILSQLTAKTKELYGIDVAIPKTGDTVTVAAVMLLIGGTGTAVLLTRKRNILS